MNTEQFEGLWHQLKGKVKQQWGELTDDELLKIEGNYEDFLGLLQRKYGYTKEQAKKEVDSFMLPHDSDKGV